MPKSGAAHHHAKLSDADVLEMRQLRESRPWLWSYGALSGNFGCSESTARDIVTYRTRINPVKDYAPREKIKVERMKSVKKPGTEGGKTRAPGYYSQRGGSWAAIEGQGGQGGGRRQVHIGSTLA